MNVIEEQGVYDISEEEYQSDPCDVPSLTASVAKVLINDSPLHAWYQHPKLNPEFVREEKEMFDLGTIAHALMLQGMNVAVLITAKDKNNETVSDYKTKAAREERDLIRASGRIPILEKHWPRIQAMIESAKRQLAAHKEAKNVFSDGKPEQSLIWAEDNGVVCRARLDWLKDSHKGFADYKSTGMTSNPESLSRSMFGNNWDIQEAFYRRGIQKIFGIEAEGLFVCQEDSAPYALSVIGFNPQVKMIGDKFVQYAIDLWAKCLESDKWPGYGDRIAYPLLTKWREDMCLKKETEDVV